MDYERESLKEEGEKLGGILRNFVLFHTKASGKIISGAGELEANFGIYQLCNGNTVIEATTEGLDHRIVTGERTVLGIKMTLEGRTEEGLSFEIEEFVASFTVNSSQNITIWRFRLRSQLSLYHGDSANAMAHSFVFAFTNVLSVSNFSLSGDGYSISLVRHEVLICWSLKVRLEKC